MEIAVIGAGSWGTALSMVLADVGWPVRLWARRAETAEAIRQQRRNPHYLSTFDLPAAVSATSSLAEAVQGAGMVVLAVPSEGISALCRELAGCVTAGQGVVCTAKGLEHDTGRRLSEVVAAELGEGRRKPVAVLSGPNLAPEVAAGVATASVAACVSHDFAAEVQAAFSTQSFRVYTTADVVGVELGGALKNIIAIGAGASDGLGFGENTKAALMTRGLAEITRLGIALGARAETFRGLSGMGDLIATCAGRKSRNHYVGFELAQGRGLDDILAGMVGQVAEGVETTRAAHRLAQRTGVEMPITAAVYATLFEGVEPKAAVRSLMTRGWRDEMEG
jgi:glycerol-3-phosphate dehydrogenase (NAD(P)+)